jgi:hypothetical protein
MLTPPQRDCEIFYFKPFRPLQPQKDPGDLKASLCLKKVENLGPGELQYLLHISCKDWRYLDRFNLPSFGSF